MHSHVVIDRQFFATAARLFPAILFLCFAPVTVPAQGDHVKDPVARRVGEPAAPKPGESHRTFRSGTATVVLTYVNGELTRASAEFRGLAPKAEYERVLELIDRLKPLGPANPHQPVFGIVTKSGWVDWQIDRENSFVSRYARTCPYDSGEDDCGTRSFAVRYWFPHSGIVESKREETGILDFVFHYVTIDAEEYRIDEDEAARIIVGQFLRYSTNADGSAFRLDP